jgi:hypothetical protein
VPCTRFEDDPPQKVDFAGFGGIEIAHGQPGAEVEGLFTACPENVTHVNGDLAEVNIHRAGCLALVAGGAMVGHIVEGGKMLLRNAAPGLLLIEKGLDEQAGGKDLVAR